MCLRKCCEELRLREMMVLNDSGFVTTEWCFPSALYHTYYLDEKMPPDLSLSL
jgi:hypothetical protein